MATIDIHRWDIFCRVIDNYGDIGVCWRLARQLANEYPFKVRLWVDEISALIQIWPEASDLDQQTLENVDVCIWRAPFDSKISSANVVIEAFACDLPDTYLAAMKRASTPPHWFNLEYLSAEDWVEGCHGLLSMHPQLGLKKAFFFPGFTHKTGGLIREASLLTERDQFLADIINRDKFLQTLGISSTKNELIVSLFGYENDSIASLIDAWSEAESPILCIIPASKILSGINNHLEQNLKTGDEFIRGSLRLKIIPFLPQTAYDYLLWASDINFIRGEDSFVRAQWAGKPFIWHIYPQEDAVHIAKLDAFLKHYLIDMHTELQDSITQLWHQWNAGADCSETWKSVIANRQHWLEHSQNWCQTLNSLGDLTSNMVHFCQKTL